jgi:hypothetical protein
MQPQVLTRRFISPKVTNQDEVAGVADYYGRLSQLGRGKIAATHYDDQTVSKTDDERRYLEADQDYS